MRNYLAALEFFQKTLAIEQKYLGSEHPDLAYTHDCIAYTLEGLQLYKEAFIHLMKAIKILSDIIESDDRHMRILLHHFQNFARQCLSRLR
jgi:tetratricopeptide (TPR) repeat protein